MGFWWYTLLLLLDTQTHSLIHISTTILHSVVLCIPPFPENEALPRLCLRRKQQSGTEVRSGTVIGRHPRRSDPNDHLSLSLSFNFPHPHLSWFWLYWTLRKLLPFVSVPFWLISRNFIKSKRRRRRRLCVLMRFVSIIIIRMKKKRNKTNDAS